MSNSIAGPCAIYMLDPKTWFSLTPSPLLPLLSRSGDIKVAISNGEAPQGAGIHHPGLLGRPQRAFIRLNFYPDWQRSAAKILGLNTPDQAIYTMSWYHFVKEASMLCV